MVKDETIHTDPEGQWLLLRRAALTGRWWLTNNGGQVFPVGP